MGARRLISALPQDFVLTVVDVGSAGGLHGRWRPLRPLVSAILFEPRGGGAGSGALGRGRTRTYPVALGDHSGEAPLYVTALPNMSSMLRPDPQRLAQFQEKGAHACVTRAEFVPVERLDELSEAEGFAPDVIKVDTQGSELLVLQGAERCLCSAVMAEIEVSFFCRYVDQPVFADIERWMNARGFELIELHRLKRYRAASSLGIRRPLLGAGQRSGRVAYADAIFMRGWESILAAAREDAGASILKGVVALLAYGKADHATALLDAGAGLLPGDRFEAIRSALSAMKRLRLPPLTSLLPRR